MTRREVLIQACDQCLKDLYSQVQPSVSWEDFVVQNEMYSNRYLLWEKTKDIDPNYIGKTRNECIGPAPYEFYYLPKDIFKEIVDSYVSAYKIDEHQNLLDTIETLKNYCKEPIVDKWIEGENGFPGHRGYDHPDNLEKEIIKILGPEAEDNPYHVHKICDKFFEFLDKAGEFYSWNHELNSFNTEIYLGASPSSNKEKVIENWKLYRNEDITIDDSIYIEED